MKVRNYHLVILILLFTLTACSNEKEANEVVPATKDAEESNSNEEKSGGESKSDELVGFQILETVKVFGGDTINLDGTIEGVDELYVSEREGNVFVSLYNKNNEKVVSGNKEGWKSISDELNTGYPPDYVRGEMIYTKEGEKLVTNKFIFENVKLLEIIGDGITAKDFYLTDTSQGEGIAVETGEQSYTLYVDNQPVLEFTDNKDVLLDGRGEQQMYADIEQKRLFFAESYGDYGTVNGLDLESGDPLFIDGKLKELETARSIDIIGDGKGSLFVVEYGDSVRISVYDSELDLLVEPFEVPVTNPDEVAVTVTEDEVHIWNYHQYELEPAIELVRLSQPTLLGSVDGTSSSEKDE
ncbi:hypothetical protein [Metabacillus litoralis]|uniref:hypothetical protein n=1 Tax=Metabacillus litoralis TaxID=152268 RepID=UPI00203AF5E8|nr:hypothetical protein [Metabacillus litoralis]MCM3412655.1 hypothetical protein [Metabacillus litoralis]